jgi:hypothetical protein
MTYILRMYIFTPYPDWWAEGRKARFSLESKSTFKAMLQIMQCVHFLWL